jgi:hypothetical protein
LFLYERGNERVNNIIGKNLQSESGLAKKRRTYPQGRRYLMANKQILMAFVVIMLFGVFGLAGCTESLDEYKMDKTIELQEYGDAKGEENYTAEKWMILQQAVTEGKQAVEGATNKSAVDAAVNDAKEAIDEVKEEREMADFVLTISVVDNTKKYGEDFVVYASLKNQSGKDISISYYYSPVTPFIENWQYPHPPFGMSPEPDVITIKNNESFHETWDIGAYGYTNPITEEKSSLPIGTHELKFRALIIIEQSETIIWSNTIKLIVK